MVWEIFALICALSKGFQRIIHREIMKHENHIAYAWFFNLLTSIYFLFLFMRGITISTLPYAWGLVLFAGFLWAVIAMIGFKSYKYVEVSLRDPVSRTDVLFAVFFSVLILQESLSLLKFIGILLIFLGLVTLSWKKNKPFAMLSNKGIQLTLLTSLLCGFVAIVDKTAVTFFLPIFYGFLMYLLPAIFLTPLAVKNMDKVKSLLSKKLIFVIITTGLGMIAYFFLLSAYMLTEVSNVFPVIQLSSIIAVIGGHFIHKEKELGTRLLGAIIMIIGSIMILRPEIVASLF